MCADDNIKPDSFVVSLISIQCLDAEIIIIIWRIQEHPPSLILKNGEVLNETKQKRNKRTEKESYEYI